MEKLNNRKPTLEEEMEHRPLSRFLLHLSRCLLGSNDEFGEEKSDHIRDSCRKSFEFISNSPVAYEEFTQWCHQCAMDFTDKDDISPEHWKNVYQNGHFATHFSAFWCITKWRFSDWERDDPPFRILPFPPFIRF